MERKNIWNLYSDEQISELKEINDKYKRCLDAGKTERECVELSVNMARDAGYRDLEEILRSGETLKAGDKVYAVNMNKMLALFRIGERPISEGMNILGAHIDSPRIDVKQNPLYENEELAYLDTHYYGGIKNINGWHSRSHCTASSSKRTEKL
jgi:Aspartyl aminopeptidase